VVGKVEVDGGGALNLNGTLVGPLACLKQSNVIIRGTLNGPLTAAQCRVEIWGLVNGPVTSVQADLIVHEEIGAKINGPIITL